jgi:hypothetical protein
MNTAIKWLLSLIAIVVIINAAFSVWVSSVTVATSYSLLGFYIGLTLFLIDIALLIGIIISVVAIVIDLIKIFYYKLTGK